MQLLSIDAYSLVDLLAQVQTAVLEGYRIDLESNERCPQNFGHRFFLTMVLQEDSEVKQEIMVKEPESVVESTENQHDPAKTEQDTNTGKRGRKAKGA